MSEQASAPTWTCQIGMETARLPNLQALARHLQDMRVGARLRGVEATLDGRLTDAPAGEPRIRIAGSDQILVLHPLRRKVAWDVALGREQAATPEEAHAFDRLCRERASRGAAAAQTGIEVVGTLVGDADGRPVAVEVRGFRWR